MFEICKSISKFNLQKLVISTWAVASPFSVKRYIRHESIKITQCFVTSESWRKEILTALKIGKEWKVHVTYPSQPCFCKGNSQFGLLRACMDVGDHSELSGASWYAYCEIEECLNSPIPVLPPLIPTSSESLILEIFSIVEHNVRPILF
ncbi:unnamed protein product [Arctia plantaginis]|uniref:Uncharacterized protein n=1 Tax=Arctia plantaginis TaxID=874455 RepID=A0A8S0ZAW5_ARCPL|nr:unnamed protein product [Arctia plantaginis]